MAVHVTNFVYTADVNAAVTNMKLMQNQMMKQQEIFDNLKSAAGTVLKAMALGAGSAAAAFGILYTSVKDYYIEIRRVEKLTKNFNVNINELNKTIQELSINYGLSADELARVATEIAKANPLLLKNKKTLEDLSKAAIANNISTEEASSLYLILSASFDEVSRSGENIIEVFDKVGYSADVTMFDLEELTEASKQSAADFQQWGLSYESMIASIASLSEVGIRGGMAGRGLRQMIRTMTTKPEFQQFLQSIGMDIDVISGGALQLDEILSGLAGTEFTGGQKQQLGQIFGARSSTAFTNLVNQYDTYNALMEDMNNNLGRTEELFEYLKDTPQYLFDSIKNMFTVPLKDNKVYDSVVRVLKEIQKILQNTNTIDNFVRGLMSLMNNLPMFISVLANMMPILNSAFQIFGVHMGNVASLLQMGNGAIMGFATNIMSTLMPVMMFSQMNNALTQSMFAAAQGSNTAAVAVQAYGINAVNALTNVLSVAYMAYNLIQNWDKMTGFQKFLTFALMAGQIASTAVSIYSIASNIGVARAAGGVFSGLQGAAMRGQLNTMNPTLMGGGASGFGMMGAMYRGNSLKMNLGKRSGFSMPISPSGKMDPYYSYTSPPMSTFKTSYDDYRSVPNSVFENSQPSYTSDQYTNMFGNYDNLDQYNNFGGFNIPQYWRQYQSGFQTRVNKPTMFQFVAGENGDETVGVFPDGSGGGGGINVNIYGNVAGNRKNFKKYLTNIIKEIQYEGKL